MKASVRRMGELMLSALQEITPKGRITTIQSTPTHEGNAVELVSALTRRYDGRIVWLVEDDPEKWSFHPQGAPVTFVKKYSARGVFSYLRSEAVFFTHGLYGAVRPSRRQVFVNLWHGDGIKRKPTAEAASRSLWPATFVSGGTQLLTQRKAHDFRMPPGSELVFGNPRVVQFQDPLPVDFLADIGVRDSPFVVWMPTFRKSSITGRGYTDSRIASSMEDLVARAKDRGVRVIVKAHRQDAESRSIRGAIVVEDHDLLSAGVSLYSLLGGAAGLITDYSSVWTDYLVLDRPIGFLIPDAETYVRNRGVYPPDVFDWLPGVRLDRPDLADVFVKEVVGEVDESSGLRAAARLRLGLASEASPADALLDELIKRGAYRRDAMADLPSHVDLPRRARIHFNE